MSSHAFTNLFDGVARELVSAITITPSLVLMESKEKYARASVTGDCIWDTGATNSVISQTVADDLGIQPVGRTVVTGVHGPEQSDEHTVCFILPNQIRIADVRVTVGDLGEHKALLGMDIINIGDLAITNTGGQTCFSFRFPLHHERIDFVKEIEHARERLKSKSDGGNQRKGSRRRRQ